MGSLVQHCQHRASPNRQPRVHQARTDMFKNTFQSGFLSILYSIGSKPLQIWEKKVRNGHIKRMTDTDIQSCVIEIMGTNVSTNYISAPADPQKTLGITFPVNYPREAFHLHDANASRRRLESNPI